MSESLRIPLSSPPRQGVFYRLAGSVAWHLGLQGLCSAEHLRDRLAIRHVELPLPALDEDLDYVTIAHLSDLHLGLLMREQNIAHCVEMVNRARPDFVVITGDFLTTTARRYARRVAGLLGELRPKVAALACLGNHDYGLWHPRTWQSPSLAEYLADHLCSAGIDTLINESRTFTRGLGSLRLAGVGEYWSSAYKPELALAGDDNSIGHGPRTPTIALVHNPDAAHDLAALGADVILAGHTHGKAEASTAVGRALFPKAHSAFTGGYYRLRGDKHLYVNRGIGNSRRTSAHTRPEVTLITLRSPARVARWEPIDVDTDATHAPALLDA